MPYKDPVAHAAYKRARRAQAKSGERTYNDKSGVSQRDKDRALKAQAHRESESIFVAFDGEGTNQPDGSQWYTLLVAATVRGRIDTHGATWTKLERYNAGGIGTQEALDFLIRLGKFRDQTIVGYFTGYDFSKILWELSVDHLTAITKGGWVIWTATDGTRYFIEWLPTKMFKAGVVEDLPSDGSRPDFFQHLDPRRRVQTYDVSGFFQCSFTKACKDWGVLTEAEYEFIQSMKDKRNDFEHEDRRKILRYCHDECVKLCELMHKLEAAMHRAGMYLRQWHGAGAIASYLFKLHGVQKHIEEPPSEVLEAVLRSYYGGRVEIFQQGWFPDGIYDYDLQSAYPSAAITLPSLKNGKWHRLSQASSQALMASNMSDMHGLFRVSYDLRTKSSRSPLNGLATSLIGALPFRHRGRISFPQAAGSNWVHGEELAAAISIWGPDKFTVYEGWLLEPQDDTLPFAFLDALLRERIALKMLGDMAHIPLKLGANSVYGKLAQGQLDELRIPPFLSYYWAGKITARTRARMHIAANLVKWDIVAIATDGLFTCAPLPGFTPSNGEPGSFSLEGGQGDPIMVLQPGIMYSGSGKVRKTRGFSKLTTDYDAVKAQWDQSGIASTLRYTERRFIGPRSALHRGKPEQNGRWVEQRRRIKFHSSNKNYEFNEYNGKPESKFLGAPYLPRPEGRKIFDPEQDRGHYRLIAEDYGDFESEPYVPRQFLDDSMSMDLMRIVNEYEERMIERDEQPDLGKVHWVESGL